MTLQQLAEDFALDLADDAQTTTCPCGDHRLGARLNCPACWAWHVAQKRPAADQASAIVRVLEEQKELAGERQLRVIAEDAVAVLRLVPPTLPEFWELLQLLVDRSAARLLPSSRRRRVIREVLAFVILDRKIAVAA